MHSHQKLRGCILEEDFEASSAVNTHQQNKPRSMLPNNNNGHAVSREAETGCKSDGAHPQEVKCEGFVSVLPVVQTTAGLPRCWGPKDP